MTGRPSRAARDFAVATLQIPALERLPIPTLAVADDGAVLFANAALAHMLSCSPDVVTSMTYEDIFYALPTTETLFAVARLHADAIGELLHLGGATIFAKMTKTARMRGGHPVAVATLEDLLKRISQLAER